MLIKGQETFIFPTGPDGDHIVNIFASVWKSIANKNPPAYAKSIQKITASEFSSIIISGSIARAREFIDCIWNGEIFVITNFVSPEHLDEFRGWVTEKRPTLPQRNTDPRASLYALGETHKGWVNYREKRTWFEEEKGGYSSIYEMMHFFRWNNESTSWFALFEPLFRTMKACSGINTDLFTGLPDQTDTVDRIEINHYPRGGGGIGFHHDPIEIIRLMFVANLSALGTDYTSGGFAVVLENNELLRVEPEVEYGSFICFCPSIGHGVEVIDPHIEEFMWDDKKGRWYVGLTSQEIFSKPGRAHAVPVRGQKTLFTQIQEVRTIN